MANRAMVLTIGQHTVRWAGGQFIPVWRTERLLQQVPDFMVQVPDSIKRSKATEDDIRHAVQTWMEGNL